MAAALDHQRQMLLWPDAHKLPRFGGWSLSLSNYLSIYLSIFLSYLSPSSGVTTLDGALPVAVCSPTSTRRSQDTASRTLIDISSQGAYNSSPAQLDEVASQPPRLRSADRQTDTRRKEPRTGLDDGRAGNPSFC